MTTVVMHKISTALIEVEVQIFLRVFPFAVPMEVARVAEAHSLKKKVDTFFLIPVYKQNHNVTADEFFS
jgi:hypothetical protein